MNAKVVLLLATTVTLFSNSASIVQETYAEDLQLKQLNNGDLLVTISIEQWTDASRHSLTFPSVIAALTDSMNIQSAELSFVRGHWDAWKWKRAPFVEHPYGAVGNCEGRSVLLLIQELMMKIQENVLEMNVAAMWSRLTRAMSGLFCGSLEAADRDGRQITVQEDNGWVMMALLPKEAVCLENLIPWLKLTPCKGKAGVTSIFHLQSFFEAGVFESHYLVLLNGLSAYFSSWLKIEKVANDRLGKLHRLGLFQKLHVVFSSQWIQNATQWLTRLRSETFHPCPVTPSSSIWIEPGGPLALKDATTGAVLSSSTIKGSDKERWSAYGGWLGLDPHGTYSLVTMPPSKTSSDDADPSDSRFEGETYLLEARGDRGTFVLDLKRRNDRHLHIDTLCILQSFPWIVRVWLHTLKFRVNNKVGCFP